MFQLIHNTFFEPCSNLNEFEVLTEYLMSVFEASHLHKADQKHLHFRAFCTTSTQRLNMKYVNAQNLQMELNQSEFQ